MGELEDVEILRSVMRSIASSYSGVSSFDVARARVQTGDPGERSRRKLSYYCVPVEEIMFSRTKDGESEGT